MTRRHLKWILGILAVPVLLFTATLFVGSRLPEAHRVTSRAEFPHPPEEVWERITAFEDYAAWREDVKGVERLPDREGRPRWIEEGPSGKLTFEQVASDPPRKLVTRVADEGLPFSGQWTFVLEEAAGGCRLSITEQGEIHHPVFRLIARKLFGLHATMDGYLTYLGKAFGHETTVEHVAVATF